VTAGVSAGPAWRGVSRRRSVAYPALPPVDEDSRGDYPCCAMMSTRCPPPTAPQTPRQILILGDLDFERWHRSGLVAIAPVERRRLLTANWQVVARTPPVFKRRSRLLSGHARRCRPPSMRQCAGTGLGFLQIVCRQDDRRAPFVDFSRRKSHIEPPISMHTAVGIENHKQCVSGMSERAIMSAASFHPPPKRDAVAFVPQLQCFSTARRAPSQRARYT